MKHIILLLLCGSFLYGECRPIKLNPLEALDHSCHLFRKEIDNRGITWVIRLKKGQVFSREAVDCNKAVYEYGVFEVYLKSIDIPIWCPVYATPSLKERLVLIIYGER
jgi:hypothetical protein